MRKICLGKNISAELCYSCFERAASPLFASRLIKATLESEVNRVVAWKEFSKNTVLLTLM